MPANTLESLARWVAAAIPTMRDAGASETEVLLNALGWAAPPGGVEVGLDTLDAGRLVRKLSELDVHIAVGGDDSPVALKVHGELLAELLGFFDRTRTFAAALGGRLAAAGDYAARTGISGDFLRRFLDRAIFQAVERHTPALHRILLLAGVFRLQYFGADAGKYQVPHVRHSIDFGRVGIALTDPARVFRETYGWGTSKFDVAQLVAAIGALLQLFGLPAMAGLLPRRVEERLLGRAVPEADSDPLPRVIVSLARDVAWEGLDVGLAVHGVRPATPGGADGGVTFSPFLRGAKSGESAFRLTGGTTLELAGRVAIEAGVAVTVRPKASVTASGDVLAGGPLKSVREPISLRLVMRPGGEAPFGLLVLPGGSRLELDALALAFGARPVGAAAEFFVEIELRKARFVLDVGGAPGAIKALIPKDAVQADLDVALGWADGRPYLRGSTDLRATFPVGLSLGPVDLQSVSVGLSPGPGGLPIDVSATLKATLGPLTMLVERIGLTAAFDFKGGGGGNVGPLLVDLAFKPPDGIGLTLEAGPVSGGGFLAIEPGHDRYAGVLRLKLWTVEAVAYGIYEQVQGQASFVAVFGVRFHPGVQLGFGFALTGVGGLVGMNRRANVDALRDRLASGASGNVLFCEDPVKNAPSILGDLGLFFPPAAGALLVGPTVQISWLLPIVRLDVAILIELPGPSKIVLVGTVRAVIGAGDAPALLYLRMDVLGVVDFEQRLVAFDASLVASHALGVFRLSGGMAFRLGYGGNPYVLLSIGGFHPRFDPGPLAIPRLARVGASLDVTVVADLYVRLDLYTAFTSNTLQAGAKVEAGMELGPLSAHGFFQFDALMQFRPFHFEVDFSAGFSVEALGFSFASVDIDGRISGPGPVVVHARGTVRRFGLKASGSATFELGSHDGDRPAPIAHPVLELAPELQQVANLRVDGEDRAIVTRPGRPAVPGVLVSPVGSLVWQQKRAPLNTIIHRLGGVPLDAQHELRLDPPPGWSTSEERDWFNPGSFTHLDLKASQTLNEATFQELPSGIRVGSTAEVRAPTEVDYEAELDLVKRPTRSRFASLLVGTYLGGALHATLRDRTATPAVDPGPAKVSVHPETADVHAADGTLLHVAQTPFQAFQLARQGAARLAVPTTDVTVNL